MTYLFIVITLFILLLLWGVLIYNSLVTKRNMTQEGWSNIDVQLKRRSDLIPNLVEAVKGYMGHEREVLETVTELRSRTGQANTIDDRAKVEGMLSAALSKIMALSENYPDLKANQTFLDLQKNLSQIEEEVQLSRRYYNGAARNFNIQIESFPSNVVANLFKFGMIPYFALENPEDREAPKVKF